MASIFEQMYRLQQSREQGLKVLASTSRPWWISTYRLHKVLKAHALTNEHVWAGWYKTVCGGAQINIEYREKVTPELVETHNISFCKKCLKITGAKNE